jgi:hypothetical protein
VRQLAWLHATPKAPASLAVNKGTPKTLSRIAKMKLDGVTPRLPEVSCKYLLDIYLEIGPVQQAGFGAIEVSQVEIGKWQENTSIRLQPWEARFVRRLSGVWLKQAREAEDPACKPPFAELANKSREQIEDKIDQVLR